MTNPASKIPDDRRLNALSKGDTLERCAQCDWCAQYDWFEIMPCRNDESEGAFVQCEAGRAEFWTIYGQSNDGTGDRPEYLATAVHDAVTPLEAVRIARQIALKTGKGFVAGDTHFGQFPRGNGRVTPVSEFTAIAEGLTFAIHEDNEVRIAPEDQRTDDFDTHPLAELREAFVAFSDYSGSDRYDRCGQCDQCDRCNQCNQCNQCDWCDQCDWYRDIEDAAN